MTVGELYKRLVLFSDDDLPPDSYHSYYQKVKDTLKEAKEDFPDMDGDVYWNGPQAIKMGRYNDDLFHEDLAKWSERWLGK